MKCVPLFLLATGLWGACRPLLVPEALYHSDQAFVGTVLAVHRYPPQGWRGCERLAIEFAVSRVVKGTVPPRHTIFTWENCYCMMGVDTRNEFAAGHEVAVFARARKAAAWLQDPRPPGWPLRDSDTIYETHECSGNFIVRDNPGQTALLSLAPLLGTRPIASISEPVVRLHYKVREALGLFP